MMRTPRRVVGPERQPTTRSSPPRLLDGWHDAGSVPARPRGMGTVGGFTAVGVKLGLAAVLAVGAALGARRLQGSRISWRVSARALRVVETAALGPQRAVHLISVGRRTLLVASTQSQIAFLADVSGEEPPAEQAAPSFAAVVSQLLSPPESTAAGPAADLQAAAQKLREGAA